jgi:hypothetical protein
MRVNVTIENVTIENVTIENGKWKMKITVKGEVGAAMWGLVRPGKTSSKRDKLSRYLSTI